MPLEREVEAPIEREIATIDSAVRENAIWHEVFAGRMTGIWHVLHTRSNQERMLQEQLDTMGVRCFLPTVRGVRYYGRRKSILDVPLFPGYVFLHGTSEDAYRADRTRRVAQLIRVVDQVQLNEELRCIETAMSRHVPLQPHPWLVKGMRVEVRAGPLKGVRGVVESLSNPSRLVLQVAVIGQANSLEIDGSLLIPLE